MLTLSGNEKPITYLSIIVAVALCPTSGTWLVEMGQYNNLYPSEAIHQRNL